MTAKVRTKERGAAASYTLSITKGAAYAVIFSLAAILLFAVIINFTSIGEGAIQPVNQVIKGVSILLGCFFAGKKIKTNGWFMGLIVGLAYTLIAYLLFSFLDVDFRLSLSILNDLLFGGITGIIGGIIVVNILKR